MEIPNIYLWLLFCGLFAVFFKIINFARRRRNSRNIENQPKTERVKAQATKQFEVNLRAAKEFITRRQENI